MNILITGGAGFIGSVVAERLIEEGHRVYILDNFSNSYYDNVPEEAFVYEADITQPDARFKAAFSYKHLVIHCAARADVQAGALDCIQTNVVGGMNVLEEMAKNDIKYIINASSAAVYGGSYWMPISEDYPCKPINDYGLSKMLFEQVLNHYGRRYGIQHTNFRYFNVVGATEKHGENRIIENHIIPRTLKAAIIGEAVNVYGDNHPTRDGTCIRDYVHISDVAEAHVLAINKQCPSGVYNIGSGEGHTVSEVISKAAIIIDKDISAIDSPAKPEDPHKLVAYIMKAYQTFGFWPRYNLNDAISHSWEWMQRKESDDR